MKYLFLFIGFTAFCFSVEAQNTRELIFPTASHWNVLNESQLLNFQLRTNRIENLSRFSIEGTEGLDIHFDTLGNFSWQPSYDLVDRVTKTKDFFIIFQAAWKDGTRVREQVTFTVNHVNRPPVVEELPIFYVKQSTRNSYQIPADHVFDPDGDPLAFKPILSKMPEGSNLTSQGLFTWNVSRGQFHALKNTPLAIEFIVQDQPDKAETMGKLRLAQTQQDLAPEIIIIPSDSLFVLKEDETLNLKIYVSDPNGDDDVKNVSFLSSDERIVRSTLKANTPLLYEFTWTPGYNFVEEVKKLVSVELIFFALDKTNNRVERKLYLKVLDTENLIERDLNQYKKYRDNLIDAMLLIEQLDQNQKKLNTDYKRAKRGKKNRSIVNASLGATSGFSPIIFQPDQAKVVGGVGGTTVLTLGTLEAAEVIGKSRQDILERIKTGIEIRNGIQSAGDEFARRFALKSARRSADFEKAIERLRTIMNDQKLVLLELDAEVKANQRAKVTNKDIKKVFLDYSDE